MTPIAPRLYHTVRGYAGRLKTMHDEFRMAHFMYSLPEDIRNEDYVPPGAFPTPDELIDEPPPDLPYVGEE